MNKLIVANWKCNPATVAEARKLFAATEKLTPAKSRTEVVIACPFPYLVEGKHILKRAKLAAEDVFWEETGAYTGEVGPRMIKSVGAEYSIVGHSERRSEFGETNEITQSKMRAVLGAGLKAILCVGEKTREGEASEYAAYVKDQVQIGLRGVPKASFRNVIVAYEPLWAIGSDEADSPERTFEMALYIRKLIADECGRATAQQVRILYGGSANAGNAKAFLRDGGVDGLLVGRASLDTKIFGKIVEAAHAV
jgi:triosephosphate isomerase (TIM)